MGRKRTTLSQLALLNSQVTPQTATRRDRSSRRFQSSLACSPAHVASPSRRTTRWLKRRRSSATTACSASQRGERAACAPRPRPKALRAACTRVRGTGRGRGRGRGRGKGRPRVGRELAQRLEVVRHTRLARELLDGWYRVVLAYGRVLRDRAYVAADGATDLGEREQVHQHGGRADDGGEGLLHEVTWLVLGLGLGLGIGIGRGRGRGLG